MKHFQGNQIHINLATQQLKHASVAHDYVIQFKGANFQTSNWPDPQHTMSYRQYNMKWTDQTHLLVKSEDRFTHIQGQIWMAKILSQHLVSKKLITKGYTQLNHKWQPRNKKPIRKEEPLGLSNPDPTLYNLALQIKQKKHSKNKIRTHKPPNMKSFKPNLITTNRSIYEKKKRINLKTLHTQMKKPIYVEDMDQKRDKLSRKKMKNPVFPLSFSPENK